MGTGHSMLNAGSFQRILALPEEYKTLLQDNILHTRLSGRQTCEQNTPARRPFGNCLRKVRGRLIAQKQGRLVLDQ